MSNSELNNAPNFRANVAEIEALTPCEPDRATSALNLNRMSRSRMEEDPIEELDLSPISIMR